MRADRSSTMRRGRLAAAITVACMLLAPAVSGCAMNPVESIVDGLTGGNVEIGGTSIPDDFPSEVPLIDAEVVSAFRVGSGAEKAWTVALKVDDASALDTIKAQLEGAGFTSEVDEGAIGGITGAMYSNATYGVLVVVADDGKGWVASYTVTPAPK